MRLKKIIGFTLAGIMLAAALVGCSDKGGAGGSAITVVSREDGSGTRGAFIELLGVEVKDADGNKRDMTTEEAVVVNSTSVVLTTVEGNDKAIGYISLGSLNDTVSALKIDGAAATAENIKSGTYRVARPFNIATGASISPIAQNFIDFILSTEGQGIVEKAGYIAIEGAQPFSGASGDGKIVIAGSSSVTPVMEKLKEGYETVNSAVKIEIQQSDSSTGMASVANGTCDIGMASREIKQSELDNGITPTVIATDGIAIIVNNGCSVSEMTAEQVRQIYTGEITDWSAIKQQG